MNLLRIADIVYILIFLVDTCDFVSEWQISNLVGQHTWRADDPEASPPYKIYGKNLIFVSGKTRSMGIHTYTVKYPITALNALTLFKILPVLAF
jgi:hypothetical protein